MIESTLMFLVIGGAFLHVFLIFYLEKSERFYYDASYLIPIFGFFKTIKLLLT